MRKFILCIIVFTLTVTNTFAAEEAGRFHIGFGLGGIVPSSEDTDPVIYPSVNIGWGINSDCAIELSVSHASFGNKDDGAGDFTMIPIQLTILPRLRLPEQNLSMYLGAGMGYYLLEAESQFIDMDDTYGVHAATGVDYFVSKKVALGLDVRYFLAWGNVEVNIMGVHSSSKIDYDSMIMSVGVKYLF